MPNVINLTITEAKKILQEFGFEVDVNGEGKIVTDQLPKKGIQINNRSKVTIYT